MIIARLQTLYVGIVILWVLSLSAWAQGTFFTQHSRGWHWYELLPPPEKERREDRKEATAHQPSSPKPSSPTAQVKAYRKELERRLHQAWLEPTPQNIVAYQTLQKEMVDRSKHFSHVWMQALFTHPQLDHTLVNPMNQMARHVQLDVHKKQVTQTIQALSQSYGLFFFFSGNCSYCHRFAPIVKQFAHTYGWEVLAISVDGGGLEAFPQAVTDEGLMAQWGVEALPALFAVNPTTGHVIPIAYGLTSLDQMEERIMTLLTEKPQ
jgi:conjugal transfer pilus assembly protein TraF